MCHFCRQLDSKQKRLAQLEDQRQKLEVQATDKVPSHQTYFTKRLNVSMFTGGEQRNCSGDFQTELLGPKDYRVLVQEMGTTY